MLRAADTRRLGTGNVRFCSLKCRPVTQSDCSRCIIIKCSLSPKYDWGLHINPQLSSNSNTSVTPGINNYIKMYVDSDGWHGVKNGYKPVIIIHNGSGCVDVIDSLWRMLPSVRKLFSCLVVEGDWFSGRAGSCFYQRIGGSIPGCSPCRCVLGQDTSNCTAKGFECWSWWADRPLHGSSSHQGVNRWMMTSSFEVLWVVGRLEKCRTCTLPFKSLGSSRQFRVFYENSHFYLSNELNIS